MVALVLFVGRRGLAAVLAALLLLAGTVGGSPR
jgi:hypothetical protein